MSFCFHILHTLVQLKCQVGNFNHCQAEMSVLSTKYSTPTDSRQPERNLIWYLIAFMLEPCLSYSESGGEECKSSRSALYTMERMQRVFHKSTAAERMFKSLSVCIEHHGKLSGYFKRIPEMSWLLHWPFNHKIRFFSDGKNRFEPQCIFLDQHRNFPLFPNHV